MEIKKETSPSQYHPCHGQVSLFQTKPDRLRKMPSDQYVDFVASKDANYSLITVSYYKRFLAFRQA